MTKELSSREDRVVTDRRGFDGASLAILATCLLCACGTHGRVPVRMPVPVACVAREDIPPEVGVAGTLPTDARAAADILAGKVLELRATDRILRLLVDGCLSDPAISPP